jgi:site-specific recombinase XerD
MVNTETLFICFLEELRFLRNSSEKTIHSYQCAFKTFQKHHPTQELTNKGLKQFVIAMVQSGLSVGSCNAYARALNSWFSWMLENQMISEPLNLDKRMGALILTLPYSFPALSLRYH